MDNRFTPFGGPGFGGPGFGGPGFGGPGFGGPGFGGPGFGGPGFGGPGFGHPFFRPFPHPFFPRRFLFPFFTFSPFFFPFVRDGADQNDMLFAQYQVQAGDTMANIAHMYNIPLLILEEANPQIANANEIRIGEIINIPRISNCHCQKTYMEKDA